MNFHLQRSVASSKDEVYEVVFQIQRMRFFVGYHEIYRGQQRDEWKLTTRLTRDVEDPVQARALEREMATAFSEKLKQEGLDIHTGIEYKRGAYNDWVLLQQAQYFGLATRFIDWTAKWEVALYFALADPKNDDVDGQFWIYLVPDELYASNPDTNRFAYLNVDPFSNEKPLFINATSFWEKEYERRVAQGRRFRQYTRLGLQPYAAFVERMETQEFHVPNLFKIIIPAAAKKEIREGLEKDGYSSELFAQGNNRIGEIVEEIRAQYALKGV